MPIYFFILYYLFIIFLYPYNITILSLDNNVFKVLILLSLLKTIPFSFEKKENIELWKLGYYNQDILVYFSCFWFWGSSSVIIISISYYIDIITNFSQTAEILEISLALTILTRVLDIILKGSEDNAFKDIVLIMILIPFLFPIFLWGNYALIVILIIPFFLEYILKEYINNK